MKLANCTLIDDVQHLLDMDTYNPHGHTYKVLCFDSPFTVSSMSFPILPDDKICNDCLQVRDTQDVKCPRCGTPNPMPGPYHHGDCPRYR